MSSAKEDYIGMHVCRCAAVMIILSAGWQKAEQHIRCYQHDWDMSDSVGYICSGMQCLVALLKLEEDRSIGAEYNILCPAVAGIG